MLHQAFRRVLAGAAATALALAACGDSGGDDGAAQGDGDGGPVTSIEVDLVNAGTLKVCSDVPFPPFEMDDGEGGFTGIDIELAEAVATPLDLEVEVQSTPIDGIFGALAAEDCDLAASALLAADVEIADVDASDPYYEPEVSLLVPDGSTIGDLASAQGRIGVRTLSTAEALVLDDPVDGREIIPLDDGPALTEALADGSVDGILDDVIVNDSRAADGAGVIVETIESDEVYVLAVRKGNGSLLDVVNDRLSALRDSGGLDEILLRFLLGEVA